MIVPGAHGPDKPAEGGRSRAKHQGRLRAQVAHPDLQDIQGPGGRPDRPTVCGRCCYQRSLA